MHPEDRQFIEDATTGEEAWGRNYQVERPQDEPVEMYPDEMAETPMDNPVEMPTDKAPMEEDETEDEVPPCQGHSSPSVPSAKVAIVEIVNYPHKG